MKKNNGLLKKRSALLRSLLIVMIALPLTQCGKDDILSRLENSIKMNGKDFLIVSASMLGVSIEDSGHTAISLVSGNATQVNTLTVDVESFTQASIQGEYAYPEESGKKRLDGWLTNYSVFDGTNMHSSNLESGEVSIALNSGNNYRIDINLTMVDGVTFTGTYSGEFQVAFHNQ